MTQKMSDALVAKLEKLIKEESLPDSFIETVNQWYLVVGKLISKTYQKKNQPILISVNGSQGSGKSTMTTFLQVLLIEHFQLNTVNISIDDFYLTKKERLENSIQIHPLLKTRGVPGTHDLDLSTEVIHSLLDSDESSITSIPRFNKAEDDRYSSTKWTIVEGKVDVILFEGWCNHAPVEPESSLAEPINSLEQEHDKDGVWRHYVNEQLGLYHKHLFSKADLLIFLKIPSFEKVYEWRLLQEQKLAQHSDSSSIMNEDELNFFIQHYQRITQSCLNSLTEHAQIVLDIDEHHQISQLVKNEF